MRKGKAEMYGLRKPAVKTLAVITSVILAFTGTVPADASPKYTESATAFGN